MLFPNKYNALFSDLIEEANLFSIIAIGLTINCLLWAYHFICINLFNLYNRAWLSCLYR